MNNIKINPLRVLIFIFLMIVFYVYFFGIPFNKIRPMDEKIHSKVILSVGIDLAERAGVLIKSIRKEPSLNEKVKGKTIEGANELITKADVESHKIIYNGFKKSFPGLNIISEEHIGIEDNLYIPNINHKSLSDFESNEYFNLKDLTIWIDPLDATQEYSENLTKYVSIMICVVLKNDPIIGIIYKPFTEETVWGYVNHKTSGINKDLQKTNKLNVLVSRSHSGDIKELIKNKLTQKNVNVISAGGAGYKFLEVLNEKATLYVHKTAIKLWDICAADAIARSVKYCSLTTLKNKQLNYSNFDRSINNDGIIVSCSPDGDKLSFLFNEL